MRPSLGIFRPACVQGIGCSDAAKVTQTRHQGGGSSDADLTVATLEDLGAPSHANRHGRPETESNHQETDIASPAMSKCGCEKASNLNANSGRKEEGTTLVKSIRNWSNKENSDEVHLRRGQSRVVRRVDVRLQSRSEQKAD